MAGEGVAARGGFVPAFGLGLCVRIVCLKGGRRIVIDVYGATQVCILAQFFNGGSQGCPLVPFRIGSAFVLSFSRIRFGCLPCYR